MAKKLIPVDAAAYVDSKEAIAEYLSIVMEQDYPDLLLKRTSKNTFFIRTPSKVYTSKWTDF